MVPRQDSKAPYEENESHLADYLNVVLRRWKISLLVALLVFATVAVRTYLQTPIYRASTTVTVHQATSDDVLKSQVMTNSYGLSKEIQLLTSRQMAADVAQRLNLNWQYQSDNDGLQVQIQSLNIDKRYPQITLEVVEDNRLRIFDGSNKLLGEVASGELFDKAGILIQVNVQKGHSGNRFALVQIPLASAAGRARSGLSVREFGNGTDMLVISVEGADPELAKNVANATAQVYYEHNIARKNAEANKMLSFVDQQLAILGGELDRSEETLQSYKIDTGLKRLSVEGLGLIESAVELEKQRTALTLDRKQIELFLDSPAANGFDFTAVEDVPGVAEASAKILELRAEQTDLLKDYTLAHPNVVAVNDQIRRVRSSILSSCRLALKRIDQQVGEISVAIAESEKKLEQVPQEELELARMTRSNQVNADLYTYLLKRQQEARITEASSTSNIEIIDLALTPTQPVRPNKRKSLLLGLIIGLMLGIGLAFLLDYMDQTIKTTEDVKQKLGLNVFGIIPRIPFADEDAKMPSKRLVTTLAPKTPVVESFRSLRTNLNFLSGKAKGKVLMVTSSLPSEGKSTVTGNLAVILSQTGSKVLLVGCDLRRPSLFDMFSVKNIPGLVDLLTNDEQSALRHIEEPRLDFISAGSIPPNPAEILDSERMRKFISTCQQRYDYVVIDAPPVLPVTDALILAPMVDYTFVVLEPCRVPEKAAVQMVESLRSVNANIAGVILNDKTGRGFKYYGNYSYYGNKYYRGYYGETHEEVKDGVFVAGLKTVWEKLNS